MPPKRTITTPVFRSSELRYLPKNVQNAVELARIEADREFIKATSDPTISDRKVSELRKKWLFRIVLGFTQAACEEISQGRRSLAQVANWRDELFDNAANSAGIEVFRSEVRDELRRSAEWRTGESLLANAAKGATEHSDGVDTLPERTRNPPPESHEVDVRNSRKPGRPKGLNPATVKRLAAWRDKGRCKTTNKNCDEIARAAGEEIPKQAHKDLRAKIRTSVRRHRSISDSELDQLLNCLSDPAK
jgi:hypothetical protein